MGSLKQALVSAVAATSLPLVALAADLAAATNVVDESPRIATLRDAATAQRADAVAAFWSSAERDGAPIVEPLADGKRIRVTFLWRAPAGGTEANVGLIGSFVPGGSRTLVPLEHVPGTNVLQKSFITDASARYRYYLAWPAGRQPNSKAVSRIPLNGLSYELFADPLAPLAFLDDFDGVRVRNSYFEGPLAPSEPWLALRQDISHGTVTTIDVESRALADTRRVSVYVPQRVPAQRSGYPFLLLFDGEAYQQLVPTPTILDNLIAEGVVPPLMAIFVHAIDGAHREADLKPNAKFVAFIVEDLLPQLRRRFELSRDPRQAVIAGSSLGGLAAAHLARLHPRTFGKVLSMSGSYWWYPDESENDDDGRAEAQSGWMSREYASAPRQPLRFYLCVGLGEGEGMLAPNRQFRDVLTARGYSLRYEEYHGDHSYLNWRSSLVAGLRYLLSES